MITIAISWLYMGVIIFLCGLFLLQLYERAVKLQGTGNPALAFFAGILFTTWYAQMFAVFSRVSLGASLCLLFFAVLYGILQRKYVKSRLEQMYQTAFPKGKRERVLFLLLLAVVFVCFALCSAGPAKLIDTDWYHAQTIRWLKEYGCVKGVANLFYALGYNNAQHYFDALFDMREIVGQSLRNTGGLFGFLIFFHGACRLVQFRNHKRHIADALAIWEIVYSIIITAFYADPYTDTLPNILILFIMTEWISSLEEDNKQAENYALYCILGVFATVAKTSAAMVVLLTVYPAFLLIREKKWKQILFFVMVGFGVSVPYFITNMITTGYPVYLLDRLDLFHVPWKVDAAILRYSVDNMVQFARMPQGTMEEALNCGLRWIPQWFLRESLSHQVLYLSIVLFVLYDVYRIIREMLFVAVKQQKMVDGWMILPRICAYLGILYWLFTIPQVKYCWSYLIFPIAVVPAYYLEKRQQNGRIWSKALCALALLLAVLYSGFYGLRTLGYMKDAAIHNLVKQADYENHVFDSVEKNGLTFYTRIEGGDIVCGYYIFPYLDNKDALDDLVVGDSLDDGFYFKQ